MQIREINARKFHYNSTRKISSSSCDLPPSLSFLAPPCNHFSSRSPLRETEAPSFPFLPSFQDARSIRII